MHWNHGIMWWNSKCVEKLCENMWRMRREIILLDKLVVWSSIKVTVGKIGECRLHYGIQSLSPTLNSWSKYGSECNISSVCWSLLVRLDRYSLKISAYFALFSESFCEKNSKSEYKLFVFRYNVKLLNCNSGAFSMKNLEIPICIWLWHSHSSKCPMRIML